MDGYHITFRYPESLVPRVAVRYQQARFYHCSETLPDIIVCGYSLSKRPLMQVRAEPCKEEAMCEHDPARLRSSLGQSRFKMEWEGGKLFCDRIWNSVWKTWILQTKEWKDDPVCYQRSIQKYGGALVPVELTAFTSGRGPSRPCTWVLCGSSLYLRFIQDHIHVMCLFALPTVIG